MPAADFDQILTESKTLAVTLERRRRLVARIAVIGGFAVIGILFAFSYASRNSLADALRAGCLRNAVNLAGDVNVLRALEKGNAAVAADPFQSEKTRTARRTENIPIAHSITLKLKRIDPSAGRVLTLAADHTFVHAGWFRCDVAYPRPSWIP